MSEHTSTNHQDLLETWRSQIRQADINNVFCHCRDCEAEWVGSAWDENCPSCGSTNIERISCWQFPDD
ncbi:MAG: hypothetical protein KFF72_00665 [Arthrospira sp. SH-MAG29]|nr:hypothetical protein [Arthrospira sp. SH-MAG29]MBS0014879.1 hypothetical protein [Arthrospira sp. SH-MAG29]